MTDRDLLVRVIKAGEHLRLPAAEAGNSSKVHVNKAGAWTVAEDIRIHAVSIPEQSEVAIYADIEVSTAPEMYLPEGHIFQSKYAGPGILHNPPTPISFAGSNITTTNISFPSGVSIHIPAGMTIYVHLDLINHAPFEVYPMTQDIYLYYTRG